MDLEYIKILVFFRRQFRAFILSNNPKSDNELILFHIIS